MAVDDTTPVVTVVDLCLHVQVTPFKLSPATPPIATVNHSLGNCGDYLLSHDIISLSGN